MSGTCSPAPFPIDAVYTWVNGSDPKFLKDLAKQKGGNAAGDTSQNRYRDWNQLLFSLRSLEQYAPWIKG